MENQKFYQQTWFAVLMLIFIAPVGIFLIWKYKKFNTIPRAILSVVFALIFIGVIIPKDAPKDDMQDTSVAGTAKHTEEPTPEPKEEPTSEPEPTPESKEEPKNEDDSKKEEDLVDSLSYGDGMYKVGTDIEAGEYILFATIDGFSAYCQVSKDSSGDIDSILSNSNFTYNEIVTIEKGQYLTLQGCNAVPFDKSVEVDTTGSGVFKVGVHIKPGEYKVQVDEGSVTGMGYIEVATDSKGDVDSIRTNDNITDSAYITVEKGEYLTLVGCHIVE